LLLCVFRHQIDTKILHSLTTDRTLCSHEKTSSQFAKVHKNDVIFRNQDRVVRKTNGFNNGPTNLRRRMTILRHDISVCMIENVKRDRLRGYGILSSSANGSLISIVTTFPKCFVPCCLEPSTPRVYRDYHCLFKQSAVINPERFLRKLWPVVGQTIQPADHIYAIWLRDLCQQSFY